MRGRAGVLAVVVVTAGLSAAVAWATETSTVSASLSFSSATLQPPTSLSATATCPNKNKGDVLVTWTSSSSMFVTGYTVTRSGGVAFTPVVLPATATSYDDTSVNGSTTYTYTVTATYQSWSSGASAPPVTTAKKC